MLSKRLSHRKDIAVAAIAAGESMTITLNGPITSVLECIRLS